MVGLEVVGEVMVRRRRQMRVGVVCLVERLRFSSRLHEQRGEGCHLLQSFPQSFDDRMGYTRALKNKSKNQQKH